MHFFSTLYKLQKQHKVFMKHKRNYLKMKRDTTRANVEQLINSLKKGKRSIISSIKKDVGPTEVTTNNDSAKKRQFSCLDEDEKHLEDEIFKKIKLGDKNFFRVYKDELEHLNQHESVVRMKKCKKLKKFLNYNSK